MLTNRSPSSSLTRVGFLAAVAVAAVALTLPALMARHDPPARSGQSSDNRSTALAKFRPPLASDGFERKVAAGLGSADLGGAWTLAGEPAAFAVSGGKGVVTLSAPAVGEAAALNDVSAAATDTTVSVALDTPQTGAGTFVSVVGRQVSQLDGYRLKLHFQSDGSVLASLVQTTGGVETTLTTSAVPRLVYAPGAVLRARLQVAGVTPTVLKAKVWPAGASEPGSWLTNATDTTSGLQRPGAVGLFAYLSSLATNAPENVSFDNLSVRVVATNDTAAPNTTLTTGPADGSTQTSTTATWGFTSNEVGSTFACRLDTADWKPCTGSVTYSGMSTGQHTVKVRATDTAGNVDNSPASRDVTVSGGSGAWVKPTAETTGVPAGTVLTRHDGDIVVTVDGTHLDAMDIHGFVRVAADNVTISRSIVRGGTSVRDIGLITDDSPVGLNLVVSDTELVPEFPSVWLDAIKGFNYTALRVNAHGTVDLAKVYGPNVTITSSWLHDTQYYAHDPNQGGSYTHNDGVQILGGTNIRIFGNWIYGGSNSALQVTQDAGIVTDAQFDSNWVDGGNCTVNIQNKPRPTLTGFDLKNNRFGHNTLYNDCAVISQPAVTLNVSGNVWDDTGEPARLRLNG